MAEELVLVERDDGLATVTLNRPEALNALSAGVRASLVEAFNTLADDDEIGVLILTGAGRAFSAGVDLTELGSGNAPSADHPTYDVVSAMDNLDKPIIGAIHGFAVTGALEVTLACDLLIAATGTRFADTHARIGGAPAWGLSARLPRMIGIKRAKEMSLTGNFVDATTAEAWGLINYVAEPEELLNTARSLARDMLSCDRSASRDVLRQMDEGWLTTLAEGREIERSISKNRVRTTELDEIREAVQRRSREQASR